MKKLLVVLAFAGVFTACNNNATESTETKDSTAPATETPAAPAADTTAKPADTTSTAAPADTTKK